MHIGSNNSSPGSGTAFPSRLRKSGFTIIELLIAVLVSSILISITVSSFALFRRSMNLDQGRIDNAQNARVALDRLTRDLRQTPFIVTSLPSNATDTSVPQPGEIEFEDGHANDLTYKRYYISGTTLRMDVKEYYFPDNPTYRVRANEVGDGGAAPNVSVISSQDIADDIQGIVVYGVNQISVLLTAIDQNSQTFKLRTIIFGRNI